MDILLRGSEVKPKPGTYKVIEAYKGKVFRLAMTCPCCKTVYYDFLGLTGEKFPASRRRRLICVECIRRWEEERSDYYLNKSRYDYKGFNKPRPEAVMLPRG